MSKPCKYCGAPIIWMVCRTTQNSAPIDVEPTEYGNIFSEDLQTYSVLPAEVAERQHGLGKKFYTNHMYTCPAKPPRKQSGQDEGVRVEET